MNERPIGMDAIPALESMDVDGAKEWVARLAAMTGGGWHADDSVADFLVPGKGVPMFTAEAAEFIDEGMDRIHQSSSGWPDPDFIYDLVGEGGTFQVERDYPGFVVDACIPGAGRTGYVSVPGRKGPSVVVEEGGRFALIEFGGPGKASEAPACTVTEVEGCRFRPSGEDEPYIDFSEMRTAAVGRECRSLREVGEALEALGAAPAPRPA